MTTPWLVQHEPNMDISIYVCKVCSLTVRVSGLWLVEHGEPKHECPGKYKKYDTVFELISPASRGFKNVGT